MSKDKYPALGKPSEWGEDPVLYDKNGEPFAVEKFNHNAEVLNKTKDMSESTVEALRVKGIPENADLNTYTETGVYTIGWHGGAQSLKNCPTIYSFKMEVTNFSNKVVQEITPTIDITIYRRTYIEGTWTKWIVYKSTDIDFSFDLSPYVTSNCTDRGSGITISGYKQAVIAIAVTLSEPILRNNVKIFSGLPKYLSGTMIGSASGIYGLTGAVELRSHTSGIEVGILLINGMGDVYIRKPYSAENTTLVLVDGSASYRTAEEAKEDLWT